MQSPMNIDDDTKRFLIGRLKWVVLYLGINLILVLVLPAPYDLISVFGLYILVNFLRVKGIIKGYEGTGGIKVCLVLCSLQRLATIEAGR